VHRRGRRGRSHAGARLRPSAAETLGRSRRALCVGIGGGGDVVGALAAAELLGDAIVGGLTWERRPVDPIPGPRRLDEIVNATRLNDAVALAGPGTAGPGGFLFCESHVARATGERTVLVDPGPGPRAIARALDDAADQLGCGRIVLLDVGGDVLAHGDEPGLASPLADAVLLACARFLRTPPVAAVFGSSDSSVWHPWSDSPYRVVECDRTLANIADSPGNDRELAIRRITIGDVIAAVDEVLESALAAS